MTKLCHWDIHVGTLRHRHTNSDTLAKMMSPETLIYSQTHSQALCSTPQTALMYLGLTKIIYLTLSSWTGSITFPETAQYKKPLSIRTAEGGPEQEVPGAQCGWAYDVQPYPCSFRILPEMHSSL